MACVVGGGCVGPGPGISCLPSLHQWADPQPEPIFPGGIPTKIHPPIKPAKCGQGPTVRAKAQIPLRGWRWGGLHHPVRLVFPCSLAWVHLGDNPPSRSQRVIMPLYHQPWASALVIIP